MNFATHEVLYLRFFSDYLDDNGELGENHFVKPDQSMNRSEFGGRWWHVVIPDPISNLGLDADEVAASKRRTLCMGVFKLDHVISMEKVVDGVSFRLRVEHDPLDHNYQHCELRLYRAGQRLMAGDVRGLRRGELKSWKRAKTWFRQQVRSHRQAAHSVLLRAEVATKSDG